MAGSPRHLRSEQHHGGGGEPGAGLRMTRQQMRYCLTLRRMLVAQRMARLLATSNPNPKPKTLTLSLSLSLSLSLTL